MFSNFSTNLNIEADSVDPDQRSSLIWVNTVCQRGFKIFQHTTKANNFFVIGALKVKCMLPTSNWKSPNIAHKWIYAELIFPTFFFIS